MRVDTPNARPDPPEECDHCGTTGVKLERFPSYGPGPQVVWSCLFCSHFLEPGSATHRNIAVMGHLLIKAIDAAVYDAPRPRSEK